MPVQRERLKRHKLFPPAWHLSIEPAVLSVPLFQKDSGRVVGVDFAGAPNSWIDAAPIRRVHNRLGVGEAMGIQPLMLVSGQLIKLSAEED